MDEIPVETDGTRARGELARFVGLACAITWTLAAPMAFAWATDRAPHPLAVPCAGMSAFGPLIAMLIVRARGGTLRAWRGEWRTLPATRLWGLAALAMFTPMALHVVALALGALFGAHVPAWLHPPRTPEATAALVVFPLGEELGWRGFAHDAAARAFGAVRGALVVGVAWGLWHLAYAVTPTAHGFDVVTFATTMAELPPYAVLFAWAFERSRRSMLVPMAFHVGAHLDHAEAATDLGRWFIGCHLVVVTALAVLAARSLREMKTDHIPRGIFSRST